MRLHDAAFLDLLNAEVNWSKKKLDHVQLCALYDLNVAFLDAFRLICHELLDEPDLPLKHQVICNATICLLKVEKTIEPPTLT